MEITGTKASFGLQTTATPTYNKSSGTLILGEANQNPAITGADVFYVAEAVIAGIGDEFAIDTSDGDTSASDSFTTGTAQVETATAAGTITATGNATVTVTASGMTGSPKAISVAVVLDDTAAEWAEKVRTALAADTDVAALFTVSGSTTSIVLTRNSSLGCNYANDGTLNIALDNGTCTGITTAATSANTTAGVASTGSLITGGDGEDFEGIALDTIATAQGIYIRCTSGSATYAATDETGTISSGEYRQFVNVSGIATLLDDIVFTATAALTGISIIIAGKTT